MGNTYLPDCYRIFNAPADLSAYDAAEKECQNIGGEIAPFASTLDQRIASAVNDFFFIFTGNYPVKWVGRSGGADNRNN